MYLFHRTSLRPSIRPLVSFRNCKYPLRLFSAIPPKTPAREWNTSDVLEWAKKIPGIKETHIRKLEEQELTGSNIFEINEERLEKYGIPGGPRINILNEIKKLKMDNPEVPNIKVEISEDRKKYLSSPSLDEIYLPINPNRFFTHSGPVNFEKHYCIPSFLRCDNLKLQRVLDLIVMEKYFVLHEQRQSGKTSFVLDLRDALNCMDNLRVLYINVEAGQQAWNDIGKGVDIILAEISSRSESLFKWNPKLIEQFKDIPPGKRLEVSLKYLTSVFYKQDQNFVLLVDEIDSLVGDTLLSVLRQLRSGYDQRPQEFPASIMLVGVRDIRDYKIYSDEQKKYVVGGSAFNISAESCRLPRFQIGHTRPLAKQHTDNTKQIVEETAIDLLQESTDGQPWCVNRVLYEATQIVPDRTLPITRSTIKTAIHNVILSRSTHLNNIETVLKDPRVRAVIEPILTGGNIESNAHAEYVEDLGLVKRNSEGQYCISNEIYAEVIPRALTNVEWLNTVLSNIKRPSYFNPNGTINMDCFVSGWITFFRDNADMWKERNKEDYHEAWPHLLFYAFVQRIVNGGGTVNREYALGSDSCDVMIKMPYGNSKEQFEIIELKRRRKNKDKKLENLLTDEWLPQLAKYLRRKNLQKGWLFVFDQRDTPKNKEDRKFEFEGEQFSVTIYFFK